MSEAMEAKATCSDCGCPPHEGKLCGCCHTDLTRPMCNKYHGRQVQGGFDPDYVAYRALVNERERLQSAAVEADAAEGRAYDAAVVARIHDKFLADFTPLERTVIAKALTDATFGSPRAEGEINAVIAKFGIEA